MPLLVLSLSSMLPFSSASAACMVSELSGSREGVEFADGVVTEDFEAFGLLPPLPDKEEKRRRMPILKWG